MITHWSEDTVHASGSGTSPYRWIAPLTVALVTIALYLPSIGGGFLSLDDDFNFVDNIDFRGFGPTQWRWALSGSHFGNYEPLNWILQGLTYRFFGLNAHAFHAVSVALLMCVAVALYFLFVRIIDLICVPSSAERQAVPFCAAAGALWFAVNPLRVECVSWASGQHYLSAGFFVILTLRAYMSGARGRAAAWFIVSLLFFPYALALPLVLAIWEAAVVPPTKGRNFLKTLISISIFALPAMLAGMMLLRSRAPGNRLLVEAPLGNADRLMAPFLNTTLLFKRSLFPVGLHPAYTFLTGTAATAYFVLGAVLLAAIVAALLRESRLAGLAACGVVSMLPLAISSSRHNYSADRYYFLSGVFLAATLAAAMFLWLRRWPRSWKILWVSTGVVLVWLTSMSWRQIGFWHDSEALWRHAVAVDPTDADAHLNLGQLFAGRGAFSEAIQQDLYALKLKPNFAEAEVNLGLALAAEGRAAEAIEHYKRAVLIKPSLIDAYNDMGLALADQGRFQEAAGYFEQTLKLAPDHLEAHSNLAAALIRLGNIDEAIAHSREALVIDPRHLNAHMNLGMALLAQGKFDEAAACFEDAMHLKPDFEPARRDLAVVRQEQSRQSVRRLH